MERVGFCGHKTGSKMSVHEQACFGGPPDQSETSVHKKPFWWTAQTEIECREWAPGTKQAERALSA